MTTYAEEKGTITRKLEWKLENSNCVLWPFITQAVCAAASLQLFCCSIKGEELGHTFVVSPIENVVGAGV